MSNPNADALKDKGVELFQQGEYDAAIELFHQARAAYAASEQSDLVAEMDVNIALMNSMDDKFDESLELLEQARQVFNGLGDSNREAQVLGNMGGVYASMGDTEQAHTCYRAAADIFRDMGEEELYGQTLIALGELQLRSGQMLTGATTYEVGLEKINNPSGPQKLLRRLFGFKNRFIPGGLPEQEETENSDAP